VRACVANRNIHAKTMTVVVYSEIVEEVG
jgi:hypothetical protein